MQIMFLISDTHIKEMELDFQKGGISYMLKKGNLLEDYTELHAIPISARPNND